MVSKKVTCLVVLAVSLALLPPVFSQSKTKIAVLDFEAKNISKETAEAVADILSTELFNSGRFNVIERKAITTLLEEQKLQMTGITDMNEAVEIGKILNVEKIMIGSVSKLGSTIIINTRVVDVKTGAMELAENTKSTRGEDGLPASIAELVKRISQKITIEGSIIKITGNAILIDLGGNAGLKMGQDLQIVRIGDYVTDLGGAIIGNSEDLIGVIRITKTNPDYSEANIIQSKMAPKLGDKVRLVTTRVEVKEPEQESQGQKKKDTKPVSTPPVF